MESLPVYKMMLWLLVIWCKVFFAAPTYVEPKTEIPKDIQTPPPEITDCDCTCRPDEQHDDGNQMARIAYLISVHNRRTIEDALYLFRAIRSPDNLILIHVDTKVDWDRDYKSSSLDLEIQACPCGSHVIVESVHSAKWSSWSMNLPTLWGMKRALQENTKSFQNNNNDVNSTWTTFINLSGDSLPVYRTHIIGKLFSTTLKGYNFVTSSSCETGLHPTNVYYFPAHWHKRRHYTFDEPEPDGDPHLEFLNRTSGQRQNISFPIYFGSQWMALTHEFVEFLIQELEYPDSIPSQFRNYLIQTERLMTDETFIPTLLVLLFNHTLPPVVDVDDGGPLATQPTIWNLRFERMDEHVPTAFGYYQTKQRYQIPPHILSSKNKTDEEKRITIDPEKPWGPYFLGAYDLAMIKHSGALFIRKVSEFVEPNLIQLLPVSSSDEIPNIDWPFEVELSPRVDWPARLKAMREAYYKKKRRQQEEEEKQQHEVKQ